MIAVGLGLWTIARLAEPLDHRLVAHVARDRTASLTVAAHVSSALGRSSVLIPATLILGVLLIRRLGWAALAPLIAVLGAEQLQLVIKSIVHRPRPRILHLEHVSGSSFPSGHATESAAVAVALILLIRGWPQYRRLAATVVLTAVAIAIGASRVYLGVHYPTDVIAGIMLGSAWGATATWWCASVRDRQPSDVSSVFD